MSYSSWGNPPCLRHSFAATKTEWQLAGSLPSAKQPCGLDRALALIVCQAFFAAAWLRARICSGVYRFRMVIQALCAGGSDVCCAAVELSVTDSTGRCSLFRDLRLSFARGDLGWH